MYFLIAPKNRTSAAQRSLFGTTYAIFKPTAETTVIRL